MSRIIDRTPVKDLKRRRPFPKSKIVAATYVLEELVREVEDIIKDLEFRENPEILKTEDSDLKRMKESDNVEEMSFTCSVPIEIDSKSDSDRIHEKKHFSYESNNVQLVSYKVLDPESSFSDGSTSFLGERRTSESSGEDSDEDNKENSSEDSDEDSDEDSEGVYEIAETINDSGDRDEFIDEGNFFSDRIGRYFRHAELLLNCNQGSGDYHSVNPEADEDLL